MPGRVPGNSAHLPREKRGVERERKTERERERERERKNERERERERICLVRIYQGPGSGFI